MSVSRRRHRRLAGVQRAGSAKRYLFIKPLDKTAVTNMNIVTNKRIYNLILRAGATNSRVVFKLRFSYPDEESSRSPEQSAAMAAWPNLNLKELKKTAMRISTTPTRVISPPNPTRCLTMA